MVLDALQRFYSRYLYMLSIFGLLLLLAACGGTNQVKQVEYLKSVDGQSNIIMMPLDVELSKLTAAGLIEPNAEWTENAKRHMVASITELMNDKGVELTQYNNDNQDPASVSIQLEKLHQAVGFSIQNHSFLPLPSRAPDAVWTLGSDALKLKEKTGADYAVFFFVRDSYSTGGRVAMSILLAFAGVGVGGGTQYGFASLVDLNTGEVVWFNRLLNTSGDLRTEEPAKETVKALLSGMPSPN